MAADEGDREYRRGWNDHADHVERIIRELEGALSNTRSFVAMSELPCNKCGEHHALEAFKPGDLVQTIVDREGFWRGLIGTVLEWRNYNAPVWVRVQLGVTGSVDARRNYSPCELHKLVSVASHIEGGGTP